MRKGDIHAVLAFRRMGFTLIELLIVISILSVISIAIYSTFSNGVEVWMRVNKESPEENLNIFLDRFSFDLRSSFKFKGIDFSGKKDGLEFPVLTVSRRFPGRTIGKVVYSYDNTGGSLRREEMDYSQVYNDERGTVRQTLENVNSLEFQYYTYDKDKKEYIWQEDWTKGGLPLAVKISLGLKNGKKIREFTRTIGIPAGG